MYKSLKSNLSVGSLVFAFWFAFSRESSSQLAQGTSIINEIFRFSVASHLHPSICTHEVPAPFVSYDEIDNYQTCFKDVASRRNKSLRHPDQDLRAPQIIRKYGYKLITYNNITTADGYILTAFRITGCRNSPPRIGKFPVMMFHAMLTSADGWFFNSDENDNLPFKLANAGYDVWLVNARGTDFSRRHVRPLFQMSINYWDFSYHEMAVYDFPAFLDVILKETGSEKVFYIGYSLGGTVYPVAMSELPRLSSKIYASFLFAPAAFIGHSNHPSRFVASTLGDLGPQGQRLLNLAMGGRFTDHIMPSLTLSMTCTPSALRCGVCATILYSSFGYDAPQMRYDRFVNAVSKFPNSFSVKEILHYSQNYKTCSFRKYDYGAKENFRRYGEIYPPSYNLTRATAPVYLYFGEGDNLVTPYDMEILRSAFPVGAVKGFFKVDWKLFNHIDFVMAKDVDKLVYKGLVQIMDEYRKNITATS